MPPEIHLSRRERQIMDILHQRGRATVAEVQAALPDPPGYSAVRALLRIMEEKGHLRHLQEGVRYVFLPNVSRETARRFALKRLLSTFFEGSIPRAVAALLEAKDTRLSNEELQNLEELINRARKEGR